MGLAQEVVIRSNGVITVSGPYRDFPGPVVKNLPSNAGDMGLIPGLGTKISHAVGQPSPWVAMKISKATAKT